MSKPVSIQEFMQMFPDDDACLEHLFQARYSCFQFYQLECAFLIVDDGRHCRTLIRAQRAAADRTHDSAERAHDVAGRGDRR